MKIALLQANLSHAQPEANGAAIEAAYSEAIRLGAEIVVGPESAIIGFPPKECRAEPSLLRRTEAECHRLMKISGSVPLLFGASTSCPDGKISSELWWCERGEPRAASPERPAGCVEGRAIAHGAELLEYNGQKIGLAVGENLGASFEPLVRAGATLIVNAVSSACALGSFVPAGYRPSWAIPSKSCLRKSFLAKQSKACAVPIANVNRAGASGRLLFDGGSCLALPCGNRQFGGLFASKVFIADTELKGDPWPDEPEAEGPWLREALTFGLSCSLRSMGLEAAIVGLSGGIDSAVVAALAAGAIGPDRVLGVAMPTRHTSAESIELAAALAKNLGIHYLALDADEPYAAASSALEKALPGRAFGLTDENLQSRCRGMLLMALSTEPAVHERLDTARCAVLSTANKSEAATGYFTMYGDAVGAIGIIGDLLKARVYALAKELGEAIPAMTIARPPTAELRPGQSDESSLLPYAQLDAILGALLEAGLTAEEIHDALDDVLSGRDLMEAKAALPRVLRLTNGSGFKRAQMPYALKVTHGA
jgi:NAD+ synthetase